MEILVIGGEVNAVAGTAVHRHPGAGIDCVLADGVPHAVLMGVTVPAQTDRVLIEKHGPVSTVGRMTRRAFEISGVCQVPTFHTGLGTSWAVAGETGLAGFLDQHPRTLTRMGIVTRGTAPTAGRHMWKWCVQGFADLVVMAIATENGLGTGYCERRP